jgi:hypothetical protein
VPRHLLPARTRQHLDPLSIRQTTVTLDTDPTSAFYFGKYNLSNPSALGSAIPLLIFSIDPRWKGAYIQQWNFTVQRDLGCNTTLHFGQNVFEGGFAQNMLEISIELAAADPGYVDMVVKFMEHFLWIARGMNRVGPNGMWVEEDGFYYDVPRFPDGTPTRLKVRSTVGLLRNA